MSTMFQKALELETDSSHQRLGYSKSRLLNLCPGLSDSYTISMTPKKHILMLEIVL